jgi:predicted ATPase
MTAKLITGIRVQGLFGLYDYKLPRSGEFSNATILYGDNGVGKSTLLRLAFHLLSGADDKGHRTALYEADFDKLEVDLASGITLTANLQKEQSSRLLTMEIVKGNKKLAIWEHEKRSTKRRFSEDDPFSFLVDLDSEGEMVRRNRTTAKGREKDQTPRGNSAYISVLAQYVPTIFILNADRRLDSDAVADPSDEMELRKVMHYGEPKRINELVVRSREIALSQALAAAGRWVSQKAVRGANQGSMNVHSVYTAVLQHLIGSQAQQGATLDKTDTNVLLHKLTAIEIKTEEYARYELASGLSVTKFRKALSSKVKEKSLLATELLKPYINSLEGRLDAVEPIYRIIHRFVAIINNFLRDKSIAFKLSQGFSIHNKLGNLLEPSQLSSGEQQLLLLFCYVLTARDNPTIFMIDEPEISLNIKWQRQLVQSLMDVTEGAKIQFIFASHSIELLAQHKNRVVKLES